jgi:hypothetical protein
MDADIKFLFRKEEQIKRMLARMIDAHEKWLRQHEVRLNEHWKHIGKK